MAQKKVYDKEFKIQAVKLGREIGFSKSAKELGVNIDTLYGQNKRAKDARLDCNTLHRTGRESADIKNHLTAQQSGNDYGFIQPCFTEYQTKGNGQFKDSVIADEASL